MQAELKGLDLVVYSVQNGVLLLQGSPIASPMPFIVPMPFSMLSRALSCLALASSQSCYQSALSRLCNMSIRH